jgi:hypothetical protein
MATMRAKPTRNTFTPELLVKQLAKDVPGFESEIPQVQAALASLVWIGATKPRQHTVHVGYMSFHCRCTLGDRQTTLRVTAFIRNPDDPRVTPVT